MTDESKIPSVEGLDPSQPDYIAKLDEGVVTLKDASRVLHAEVEDAHEQDLVDVVELLKAEGFDVSDPENLFHTREEFGGGSRRINLSTTCVTIEGDEAQQKADARKIEDLMDSYKIEMDARNTGFKARAKMIGRAAEDHIDLLAGATQITPLNDTDPTYPTVHIFTKAPDGIYERHIDLEAGKETGSEKSETLKPEWFDDEKFIGSIREEASRAKANSFLVSNASTILKQKTVSSYAAKKIYSQIADQLEAVTGKEQAEAVGKGPAAAFFNAIKAARDYFGMD